MGSLSWSPLPPLCIQFCNTHPTSLASFFCCCCCFGFRRTFGTGWRSSKGEWHERSRLFECVCKRERLRKREREKEFKRAGAQRHWWTTRSLDILTLVSTSTSLSAFISLFNISIVHGASLWKPENRKILLQKHLCKCKKKLWGGTDCQDLSWHKNIHKHIYTFQCKTQTQVPKLWPFVLIHHKGKNLGGYDAKVSQISVNVFANNSSIWNVNQLGNFRGLFSFLQKNILSSTTSIPPPSCYQEVCLI